LRERGWNDAQIDQRNAAQLPVEKKLLLADYAVWTEGPLDVHEAQLRRIIP
jgi:dephospho-CoA kinase